MSERTDEQVHERMDKLKDMIKDIAFEIEHSMSAEVYSTDVEDLEWAMKRLEEMDKEKDRLKETVQEIKRTIEETPYREYTTNKTRFRLLELVKKGLGEKEIDPI